MLRFIPDNNWPSSGIGFDPNYFDTSDIEFHAWDQNDFTEGMSVTIQGDLESNGDKSTFSNNSATATINIYSTESN